MSPIASGLLLEVFPRSGTASGADGERHATSLAAAVPSPSEREGVPDMSPIASGLLLEVFPIGVGTGHWFAPPLPPNRTGGFPASGSPIDDC
jgi:hypothetical protein